MFCRDFRHQIEKNEAVLTTSLEQARERFFSNLSVLQLQLPELAQQLRELQPTRFTLAVDKFGAGNCIDTERLAMHWPPTTFRRNYALQEKQSNTQSFALIAAELEDSGEQLAAYLAQQSAPFILLYVRSIELLYASLHFTDWLPVLQSKTLLVQLQGSLIPAANQANSAQLQADLTTLASHGVNTEPYQLIQPQPTITTAEQVWHFEQSLTYNHDCDPVLRRHTHKFQWHPEFRLQNLLIDTARKQPMKLPVQPWTLILCGSAHQAIFETAAALPKLSQVILINTQPIPEALVDIFSQRGVQVHECIAPVKDIATQFVSLLEQLPVESAWFCRLYQTGLSHEAQQLRQAAELELRYRVQPAMGIRRSLAAAAQASAVPQNMLTRRTTWPLQLDKKMPLLLLGNGPSLEATITAILQGHAAGYLLVSCGTTLSTLFRHNITPHIHLELELATNAFNDIDKDYLANIHFIAPLGFQHQWRKHFGSHSSFISSSYPIDDLVPGLPDDTIRVTDAFPTVLNLGVSLAGRLGAEHVWLAGFDLAFEDITSSHAPGSVYAQRDPSNYVLSSGELIPVTTIDGRAAFTKREFQLAAFQCQHTLRRFSSMNAYQLCAGLDLGASYRESLVPVVKPAVNINRSTLVKNNCSPITVNWHKVPQAYKAAPLLALFVQANSTVQAAEQYYKLLQQPKLVLAQVRRKRAPAELWCEGLKRNLAALLLRLELASVADLAAAHELFTAMLEDLALHEASM